MLCPCDKVPNLGPPMEEHNRTQIAYGEDYLPAIFIKPEGAKLGLVLAHGAGAGMEHPFMEAFAQGLAARGVATLRWNFPYMAAGKKRPDSPKVALAAWEAVAKEAPKLSADLKWFAGGKSFGGRMASLAAAEGRISTDIQGLVFVGFPLHAAGKPSTKRADHLPNLGLPSLFLQGTRDALADLTLLEPLVKGLPTATIRIFEGADHSFKMLKRSGISDEAMLNEIMDATVEWLQKY